jgi:hypothetical protein
MPISTVLFRLDGTALAAAYAIDPRGSGPYTARAKNVIRKSGYRLSGTIKLRRQSERVAQAVEHVTFNHGVEGSSPSALTNKINRLV